jgi:hypothetical protein
LALFAVAALAAGRGASEAASYSSPHAIEASFLEGLAALERGENDAAIRIFRDILAMSNFYFPLLLLSGDSFFFDYSMLVTRMTQYLNKIFPITITLPK